MAPLKLLASSLRKAAAFVALFLGAQPVLADSGLLLKQTSARYGVVTCIATNQNFRMDASELRVFLKPPFKSLDMYNMSSHTRLSCTVDSIGKDIDWRIQTAHEKKTGAKEIVVTRGKEKLQDFNLTHYGIDLTYPKQPTKPNSAKLEFWTTKDDGFPKALEDACCVLTGLPSGYGLPMRMYSYQNKRSRNGREFREHFKVLDTTKISKQDFPDTTFAQPRGYKVVDNVMDLMVSGDSGL